MVFPLWRCEMRRWTGGMNIHLFTELNFGLHQGPSGLTHGHLSIWTKVDLKALMMMERVCQITSVTSGCRCDRWKEKTLGSTIFDSQSWKRAVLVTFRSIIQFFQNVIDTWVRLKIRYYPKMPISLGHFFHWRLDLGVPMGTLFSDRPTISVSPLGAKDGMVNLSNPKKMTHHFLAIINGKPMVNPIINHRWMLYDVMFTLFSHGRCLDGVWHWHWVHHQKLPQKLRPSPRSSCSASVSSNASTKPGGLSKSSSSFQNSKEMGECQDHTQNG